MFAHGLRFSQAALVVALAGTLACSQTDVQLPSAPSPVLTLPPVQLMVLDTPYFKGTREAAVAIRAAEERVSWVSRIHSEAIREAVAERKSWTKQQRKDGARVCEQAKRLGLKYLARAHAIEGRKVTDQESLQMAYLGLERSSTCKPYLATLFPRSMNVFAPRADLASTYRAANQPSAELAAFQRAMQAANEGAGTNGYALVTSLNAIVNDAYSVLTQEEFDVVVAQAHLSISSSIEWQALSTSGDGWEQGCSTSCAQPMMIFKRSWKQLDAILTGYRIYLWLTMDARARTVAVADAAGFCGSWGLGLMNSTAISAIASIAAY